MLGIDGFYLFLGPVAAATFGGDFNVALRFAGSSKFLRVADIGSRRHESPNEQCTLWNSFLNIFLVQPEQSGSLYPRFGPWMIGTVLITLVYLPLPQVSHRPQSCRSGVLGFCSDRG